MDSQKFAVAYRLSNDFRIGLLKEISESNENENLWGVAAEYVYSPKSWFKGRLTSLGVFSLFNRYLLDKNWAVETFVETGLDAKHRIQGIAGSNVFAGLKLMYNE